MMSLGGKHVLLCYVFSILFLPLSTGIKVGFHFKLSHAINCTRDLYENDASSETYKNVVKKIQSDVQTAHNVITNIYRDDLISCFVKDSVCIGTSVIVGAEVNVKNMSDAMLKDFKANFINIIEDTASVANVTVGPLVRHNPVLYAMLKGGIANEHVCDYIGTFREKLANTLILDDGVSKAKAGQVVIFQNHPCHGKGEELLDGLRFFISRDVVSEADVGLTNLAYRVVQQMIYDGTTWRLGVHLYKNLDKIELFGSAKEDPGLNDMEITYIGFGAVCLLLLLILLVIKVLEYYEKCFGKDDSMEVYVGPSTGITNALFETDKLPDEEEEKEEDKTCDVIDGDEVSCRTPNGDGVYIEKYQSISNGHDDYEEVGDELEIQANDEATFEVPPPPIDSPKYFDYSQTYMYDNDAEGDAALTTNDYEFDNNMVFVDSPSAPASEITEEQNMTSHHYDGKAPIAIGESDEAVEDYEYDNNMETKNDENVIMEGNISVELDNESIIDEYVEVLPPSEFDSFSEDEGEDDIVEGKTLDVNGLISMLEDEDALLQEYNKLANNVPDASFYPEGVMVKNRAPKCFPWPESRVPIHVDQDVGDDPLPDYINASFVKDSTGAIAYLSTQAPLESTSHHFWQMIWERNIIVIVMVTSFSSYGEELCHQYYPFDDDKAHVYGDINVEFVKEDWKQDFVITTLNVTLRQDKFRQLYLYRYISWNHDYNIPDNSKSLVAFVLEIKELCDSIQSLPIIHCSSGRGMSGVLLALLNGMMCIQEHNVVDMKNVVEKLRKDIPGAVENIQQYKFLYEAMYDFATYTQHI